MFQKSLYFLPAWQRNKRDPNHFMVNTAVFMGFFYCPSRCGHNAVCVNDDLIIWGGYSEPEFGHAQYCEKGALWVYNMDNDFWYSVNTEGEGPLYRSGAVSALCWPYWYIIGGHTADGCVNDVYALNLTTLQWQEIKTSYPGLSKRDKASAWFWRNRIYVFGGYGLQPKLEAWDADKGDVFTIESSRPPIIYIEIKEAENINWTYRGWNNQVVYLDLETSEWVLPDAKGRRPLSRAAHSSTLVSNNVYIFGGRHKSRRMNDLHRFDLESEMWADNIVCLGELPCGRSWHTMTKTDSSHLLLFGGYDNEEVPLEDLWQLNISTYSWQLLAKKTGFPRLWHTANVNSHGDILVFGGCLTKITDETAHMDTSSKVVLFKTQPFSLQRMCLHTLFNNRRQTEHLWDDLPRDFREWLNNRCQFYLEMSPDYYEHTTELGFGPSLSSLSVMSKEEATELNERSSTDSEDLAL